MTVASLMSLAPDLLTGIAALLLVYAAGCDVLTRTIPNTVPALLALVGVALRGLDGSLPWAAFAATIVFAVALFCWLRGWMGGGDVKLLGACALLVPPVSVAPMITMVGIAGGILALFYIIARRLVGAPAARDLAVRPRGLLARGLRAERWRLARGGALPYAVAIAAGGLLTLS